MRLVLGIFFAFMVAAALGLGLTWLTLSKGVAFGGVSIGAWTAYPKIGTIEIDPYARATLARIGLLPVGSGDGIAFIARGDDRGRQLDGRCDVTISGTSPPARFWTVTLYDPEGRLVANSVNRYGFTSQEIVRRSDGSFEVVVGPRANPGNWLPTGGVEKYALMLRLYDTAVGVSTKAGREVPMPTVKIRSCP